MTHSPDSLIPSDSGQPDPEKRDDKAFKCRQEGEANLRAATQVNAVSASSTPPVSRPTQLDLFPGRFAGTTCSSDSPPVRMLAVERVAFSSRTDVLLPVADGVSRFSRMEFPDMPGVSDCAVSLRDLRVSSPTVWPSASQNGVGTQ